MTSTTPTGGRLDPAPRRHDGERRADPAGTHPAPQMPPCMADLGEYQTGLGGPGLECGGAEIRPECVFPGVAPVPQDRRQRRERLASEPSGRGLAGFHESPRARSRIAGRSFVTGAASIRSRMADGAPVGDRPAGGCRVRLPAGWSCASPSPYFRLPATRWRAGWNSCGFRKSTSSSGLRSPRPGRRAWRRRASGWDVSGARSAFSGRRPGVYTSAVGYAGGLTPNPNYRDGVHRPHGPRRSRPRGLRPRAGDVRRAPADLLAEP